MNRFLDNDSIEDIKTRWKLAQRHLLGASEETEGGELALHAVICHDIPILLDELRRLETRAAAG